MKNLKKLIVPLCLICGQYALGDPASTVAATIAALSEINPNTGQPVLCSVAQDIAAMNSTQKATNYPNLLELFNAGLDLSTLCMQNAADLTTAGAILHDFVATNIATNNGMLRWTTSTRLASLFSTYPAAVEAATISGSSTSLDKIANFAAWSTNTTGYGSLLTMLDEIQAIEAAVVNFNSVGLTNDALVTDL